MRIEPPSLLAGNEVKKRQTATSSSYLEKPSGPLHAGAATRDELSATSRVARVAAEEAAAAAAAVATARGELGGVMAA